jgi:ankyrin repeat protein
MIPAITPHPSEKEAIEEGMDVINTLSLPFRAIDEGLKWVCNSTETTQKVCRAIGNAVTKSLDAAAPLVPQSVRAWANRLPVDLPLRLEVMYGIAPEKTSHFLESAGILATSALLAGAGKVIGSVARNAVASVKMDNAIRKVTSAAVNNNHPYLPKTFKVHAITLKNGTVDLSTIKRADGSMTVFVDYLESFDAGVKTSGVTSQWFSAMKSLAQKEGATKVYVQWQPANERLFELMKKNPQLSYLGHKPHPLPTQMLEGASSVRLWFYAHESFPIFHMKSYKKELGSALFAYGLGQYGTEAFAEGLQQNGLTDSYNASHPDRPILAMQRVGGEIGGVGHQVGIIEGLIPHLDKFKEKQHVFHLPFEWISFTNQELKQMIRELAIGIYVHDTVPFFSLHFNSEHHLYPLIHPAYQHTSVGRTMALLDYYMKGFLNGAIFDEELIENYQRSKNQDEQFLKSKCIDLHDYCQAELGPDCQYFSIREMLDIFERADAEQASLEKTQESPILSEYSGFRSSFQIIANQKNKSIRKAENLFMLDPDFDVFYTIEPDAVYAEELKKYRHQFGCDPAAYKRLVKAYDAMCRQIKTFMPRLSKFRPLFQKLGVINFFCYYFKTLKSAYKVPVFESSQADASLSCPFLFPHLPIRKMQRQELTLNLKKVFENLSSKDKQIIKRFVEAFSASADLPQHILDIIAPSLKKCIKESAKYPIPDEALSPSKYCKIIRDFLRDVAQSSKQFKAESQQLLKVQETRENKTKEVIQHNRDVRRRQTEEIEKIKTKISSFEQSIKNLRGQQTELSGFIGQPRYDQVKVSQGLTEINRQISEGNGYIDGFKKEQRKMEDNLKTIQKLIDQGKKELTLILEKKKECREILQDPVVFSFSHGILPLTPTNPVIQLFSELPEEEKQQTKWIVGGCGLNLKPIPLEYDLSGRQILSQHFPQLMEVADEELIPVLSTNQEEELEVKGYLFKLHFRSYSASKSEDYAWMQFALTADHPAAAIHKAATFTSLQQEDLATFKRKIKRKECLQAQDCHGVSLVHYAAAMPSSAYLKELIALNGDLKVQDPFGLTPLHYAAKEGRLEQMQLLLALAPDLLNLNGNNDASALHLAVQHNQGQAVHFLLKKGIDINSRMAHGMTSLYCAIHHGFEEIALELIQDPRIDVNLSLEDGTTPLYLAVETEKLKIAERLLAKKADPNLCRIDSYTPLHSAAKKGSEAMCRLLLGTPGVNPNAQLKSGKTALHLAAQHNRPEIVRLLLEKGAKLSTVGWDLETPFLLAVHQGNTPAVREMIERAKETVTFDTQSYRILDYPNIKRETPLDIALSSRFYEILELLLNQGVSVPPPAIFLLQLCKAKVDPLMIRQFIDQHPVPPQDLQQAYYYAAKYGHNPMVSLFQVLYHCKDFQDAKGWSVIHYAAQYDHLSVVKSVLKSFKNLVKKDKGQKTIAAIAAEYGSHRVLKLLLEAMQQNNVSLEAQDQDRHLLAVAIESGSQPCVELILNQLAHPDIPLDAQKRCATHLAAKDGNVEMLDFLRTRGASLSIADKTGRTAFHYAFEYQWEDVIAYLLNEKYELKPPADLLHFVAGHGTVSHVKMLIKKGFNPQAEALIKSGYSGKDSYSNGSWEFPVLEAIHENRLACFQALHASGADLEARSPNFQTPLILAALQGKAEFVEYILKHTHRHEKAVMGETALHLAVQSGSEECVAALLKAGFDPLEKCPEGAALELAEKKKYSHLVMLMRGEDQKQQRKKSLIIQALKNGDEKLFFEQIDGLPLNQPMTFDVEGKKSCLPLLHRIYLFSIKQEKTKRILQRFLTLKEVDRKVKAPNGQTLGHLMAQNEEIEDLHIDPLSQDEQGVSILHLYASGSNATFLKKACERCKTVDLEDKKGMTPLHDAIINKKPENVKMLLQKGANPNHLTRKRATPLLLAIEQELPLVVQELLGNGAKVNQCALSDQSTALHFSIEKGFLDLVKLLIAHGANVDQPNLYGVYPIHLAAKKGNRALIQLLQAAGASLRVKDFEGKTLTHYAAESNHPELLDDLKEAGFALDKQTKIAHPSLRKSHLQFEGITPLHLAAQNGDVRTVQNLMESGGDLEASDPRSRLLFYAAKSGKKEVVKLFSTHPVMRNADQRKNAILAAIFKDAAHLLEIFYGKGIPPDLCLDNQGTTGLHLAAEAGATRCIHYLIKRGADPQKTNLEGETAFELAIKTHHLVQVAELARNSTGWDVHRKLKEDKTYLHAASEAGDVEIASWLISQGVTLDEMDAHGLTPLHYAIKRGDHPLVHLLLACGADPVKKTAEGKTGLDLLPTHASALKNLLQTYQTAREAQAKWRDSRLHVAIRLNDQDHFPLLLKLDDVNHASRFGATPLHVAVMQGDSFFFRQLIEKGADIEWRDDQGRTPLFLAASQGTNLQIIQHLLQLRADLKLKDLQQRTLLHAITERKDHAFALPIFDLIYQHLPKESTKEGNAVFGEALFNDSLEDFFHAIHLGLHLKPQHTLPLNLAVGYGAHQIVPILLQWFRIEAFGPANTFNPLSKAYSLENESAGKKIFLALYEHAKTHPLRKESEVHSFIQGHFFEGVLDFSKYRIDFHQIDKDNGNSLLHIAAKSNSLDIAKFLLWFGLGSNFANQLGNTPLHLAANFHYVEMIQLLLDRGANPHAVNKNGWTPLTLALQKPIQAPIVELFKNKNVEINYSHQSFSQLQIAARENKSQVLKNLLQLGAKPLPFVLKKEHSSELNLIIQKKNTATLRAFCEFACDVKEKQMLEDLHKLYLYAIQLQPSYLKILHDYPLVSQQREGASHICLAIQSNQLESLSFLISKNIPLVWEKQTLKDHPLYLALEKGNPEMVQLIYQKLMQNIPKKEECQRKLTEAILKNVPEQFIEVFSQGFCLQSTSFVALAEKNQRKAFVNYLKLLAG